MVDQEKIHNQCLSDDPNERIRALEQLKDSFSQLPDKQQAWDDLVKLAYDENSSVGFEAACSLCSVFSHVPDKQQTWNDLYELTKHEYWSKMYHNTSEYCYNTKIQQNALNNLRFMINIDPFGAKFEGASQLTKSLSKMERSTSKTFISARLETTSSLISLFSQVPDKQQAWADLHVLTEDGNREIRIKTVNAIKSMFSYIPDKQQAWNDLLRLIDYKDSSVSLNAASALGSVFSQVPDKQQAWNDLHRLTSDENSSVRHNAASALGSAFSYVPDKQQAWNDLHRLTSDEDNWVRHNAASALGSAFSYVPDKQQAWKGLHRLTSDEDNWVRYNAASALGSVFSYVPDKQQAWNDLIKLTNDEDSSVRHNAASSLGSAFSQVPDKQQVWSDLQRLAIDKDNLVRSYANNSLGRVSIFKASNTEKDEDYKTELEKAIKFFEIAAKEATYFNPAQFCLPFYRSFHTIIFKKQEAKEEVEKYLEEAKVAIGGSESKKQLFEVVEKLTNALKEVQNLENIDLEAKKSKLDFYRQCCDYATEIMKNTEDKAPYAVVTIRKGLPILDKNIKELLEKVQEKAEIACKGSTGTVTQEIACTINSEVQKLEIRDPEKMAQYIEDLAHALKNLVADIPENEYILHKINLMRNERNLTEKIQILSCIIGLIPKKSKVSIEVYGNENNFIVYSEGSNINTSKDTYIGSNESRKVGEEVDNVTVNSKDSDNSVSEDPHISEGIPKPTEHSKILELIFEYQKEIITGAIASVVGSIIFVIIQKKYFP